MIKSSEILSNSKDPRCRLNDENRLGFTPHVYEVHGNAYYMHCSNETIGCSRVLLPMPTVEEFEAAYEAAEEKVITKENGVQ